VKETGGRQAGGVGELASVIRPPADAPVAAGRRGGEVSWRAVLAGLAILALLAPTCFFLEIVWGGESIVAGAPAPLPIVLLFLLAAITATPILGRARFSRQELLVVYSMVLVGGPLFNTQVLFYLIPKVVTYYYLAYGNPLWGPTFFRYVPAWWAPTDVRAVEGFFDGRAQVPWSLWWGPLAAWLSFMLALWMSAFCTVILMGRQWITHERLSFPLAQIPLEVVREPRPGQAQGVGRIQLSGTFWVGFAVALFLTFLDALAKRVPSVPSIPLGPVTVIAPNPTGLLSQVYDVQLILYPWMLALIFLVPREITFSAWFLWLVHMALNVGAVALYGAGGNGHEFWSLPATVQGAGGVFALAFWVFWSGRHHLVHVARCIFRRQTGAIETQEPLLYRLAFIVLIISLVWMVCFCWISGCRLFFCLVLLGMIVGYYVFWARLRAETGLGFLWFPEDTRWILIDFGSSSYRPAEIVTLLTMRWASNGLADASLAVSTGNAMEALKIGDAAGIRWPRLTASMVAAFVFAMAIGTFVLLTGMYKHGYFGTAAGGSYSSIGVPWHSREEGEAIYQYINTPSEAGGSGILAALAAGAAFVVILATLRLYFWWWPLHPMGYLISCIWSMHFHFFAFFLAWACKVLVIRYGGLRLYRKAVPVAVGLIVGSMLNAVIWSIVDVVAKMHG